MSNTNDLVLPGDKVTICLDGHVVEIVFREHTTVNSSISGKRDTYLLFLEVLEDGTNQIQWGSKPVELHYM